jgi:hypothetical protein
MAIITIASSKPNVRFCSTIPENFPKKKPQRRNTSRNSKNAEYQRKQRLQIYAQIRKKLPKWTLLLYCRKLYEQFEETKIICLSSKPHQE